MSEEQSFAIRVAPVWRPLLLVAGVTRARASATIGGDTLRVRFGFFDRTYPLASVASVGTRKGSLLTGAGIHADLRGGVFVNGDFGEITELTFREEQRAAIPFPVRFRRLGMTLEDAPAFVAAIRARMGVA